MTVYMCHCGDAHDSAVQGPCPQTFTLVYPGNVRAIMTTALDRFILASALRVRHPSMSKSLQALHGRLLPTRDELQRNADFAATMAAATTLQRMKILEEEAQRCEAEDKFISEASRG